MLLILKLLLRFSVKELNCTPVNFKNCGKCHVVLASGEFYLQKVKETWLTPVSVFTDQ